MESSIKQPKIRQTKRLIEDFRSISISQLGRGVLRHDRQTDGGFWLDEALLRPDGRYCIVHEKDGSVTVELSYPSGRSHMPTHHSIQLEDAAVTFGRKPFFRCPSCESRRNKLQIDRSGAIACRGCWNLTYQSTRENHENPLFRAFRKCMKIILKQSDIKRIEHGGRLTRRAASLIKNANKLSAECHRI